MSNQSLHILLYTGSFIEIQRLQLDLQDAEIPFLVKNHNESAKAAGFGALSDNVELFIFESDYEEASGVLRALKA